MILNCVLFFCMYSSTFLNYSNYTTILVTTTQQIQFPFFLLHSVSIHFTMFSFPAQSLRARLVASPSQLLPNSKKKKSSLYFMCTHIPRHVLKINFQEFTRNSSLFEMCRLLEMVQFNILLIKLTDIFAIIIQDRKTFSSGLYSIKMAKYEFIACPISLANIIRKSYTEMTYLIVSTLMPIK